MLDRRSFLGIMALTPFAAALRTRKTPENVAEQKPLRYAETVSRLQIIPAERRQILAENPEKKTPPELNLQAPEINAIELDNAISPAAKPGETLRLVAWNLERGRYWREAVKLIQEHPALSSPDIVLLSEMDLGMARSGNEHTTRSLAQVLGMNYAYGVEYLELSGGDERERKQAAGKNEYGYHGNAILSRFPLSNLRMLRFPGIEKWYGSDQHRLGGRIALFAELVTEGTPLTLISTHLESDLYDDWVRTQQGGFIRDELDRSASGNPVILAGDFNSPPARPVIQAFKQAGFEADACNDLSKPTSQCLLSGKPALCLAHIDYFLLRGLKALSPAVVLAACPQNETGQLLSDHAAIAVTVRKS